MGFHKADAASEAVRYYTFESLEACGAPHAAFTRQGGVSTSPWASLNVGGTVGDNPAHVAENRRRAFQALGRPLESLYDVWQVHGKEVVCTRAPRQPNAPHLQADVILTDQPGVTLFMRFADCVPIFLYDPRRKVAGLAHAGWQGTLKRVAAQAARVMQEHYHCDPADIQAGIGPSIGPHHYQVGPEIVAQIQQAFGQDAAGLLSALYSKQQNSRVQFDLWNANRLVLEQAGVRKVEVSGICTACALADWYSHRGEGGKTGRFGALIAVS